MMDASVDQRMKYKGIDAITLENDSIRCVFLPSYGGKMVSFYDKKADYEWLFQTDQDSLTPPPYGADFSAYDSSGFDEMFPGIDQGPHPTVKQEIPDHGEVWALPWSYKEGDRCLSLEVESPVFPYRLKKLVTLEEQGIHIAYEAINESKQPFPFIWTPHALMNLNKATEIVVPEHLDKIINVEKTSMHLGEWGTCHSYPETTSLKTGEALDLAKLRPFEKGTFEKFYFQEKLQEGWCSLVQTDISRKLTYHFPKDKVPYLGIWKTYGGYRGEYNVALEPCTGVYDDVYLAEKIGKASSIPAKGSYKWSLTLKVEECI